MKQLHEFNEKQNSLIAGNSNVMTSSFCGKRETEGNATMQEDVSLDGKRLGSSAQHLPEVLSYKDLSSGKSVHPHVCWHRRYSMNNSYR